MPNIDLPETIKRITFSDEIWEWLDLLGDAVFMTMKETMLHEDFRRDTPYKELLVRAANKDLSTLDAIYILLRCELIHQASAQLRLFCEGLITLRYIAQDPDSRADQFSAYADIDAYERADALLEFERNGADPQHVIRVEAFRQKLTEKYRQLRPRYSFTDNKGKQRRFKNWCNKSIADQANECGHDLVRLYNLVYKAMSSYVHGSAWSMRRQLAYSRIHYRPDIVLNDIATIVRITIIVWAEFAKFWDAQLGWNLVQATRAFPERLAELDAKHFPTSRDKRAGEHKSPAPKGKRTRATRESTGMQSGNLAEHPAPRDAGRTFETPDTVFSSVDEFISSMREELPVLRAGAIIARAFGDKQRLAEAERLIAFLEDTEKLRERMKSHARSDGSVHFGFTPAAWARFNEYKKRGK